jgi:hypothetical protein
VIKSGQGIGKDGKGRVLAYVEVIFQSLKIFIRMQKQKCCKLASTFGTVVT